MSAPAMLVVLALQLAAAGGPEPPVLRPGGFVEGTERARLVLARPGMVTLARRGSGALAVLDRHGTLRAAAEDGWLVVELPAGESVVEIDADAGESDLLLVALAGAVAHDPGRTSTEWADEAFAALAVGDLAACRKAALVALRTPGALDAHARARIALVEILRLEGRHHDALALVVDVIEDLQQRPPGGNLVFAFYTLGQVYLARGEMDAAERVLVLVRETTSNREMRALAGVQLARVALLRGEDDHALAACDEALAQVAGEEARSPEVIHHVAAVLVQLGRVERAVALLEDIADDESGAAPLRALGLLATLHVQQGRHARAAACIARIDELCAGADDAPWRAPVLRLKAHAAYELGDYGGARECLEQILQLDLEDDVRGDVLADLAQILELQGELLAAEDVGFSALLHATGPGPARWRALAGMAHLHHRRGEWPQGWSVAVEALSVADGLKDPVLSAASLTMLATIDRHLGRPEHARAEAEAAAASLHSLPEQGLLRLSALHSVAAAALDLGEMDLVECLLEDAWIALHDERASSLSALEAAMLRGHAGELAPWSELAHDLTAQRLASAGGRDLDVVVDGFERAASWKDLTLQRGLSGSSARRGAVGPALQALLGGDTLVEYVRGSARLFAYVLDPAGLRLVDLGPHDAIDRSLEAFLRGISRAEGLADAASLARDGTELYQRLLAPLGPLAGALVVVPCGDLARLPFEALVTSAPPSPAHVDDLEFLLDATAVSYAPSTATLVELSVRPVPEHRAASVLFGDPIYPDEHVAGLLALRSSPEPLPRLLRTRDEILRHARLLLLREGATAAQDLLALTALEPERSGALSSPRLEVRLGAAATVPALRELAAGCSVLHVAAHGRVDPWDPRRSGLVLTSIDEDGGLLSLPEIASLPLSAELVILSGCETADGRVLRGEGIQSMGHSFLMAGARGVVASHWRVSDWRTSALMDRFQRGVLLEGESAPEALRAAKLELRHSAGVRGASPGPLPDAGDDSAHPFYWAAFVYTGAVTDSR